MAQEYEIKFTSIHRESLRRLYGDSEVVYEKSASKIGHIVQYMFFYIGTIQYMRQTQDFQHTVPFGSMPDGVHSAKANSVFFKKGNIEDTNEYRRAQTIIDVFFYTQGDAAEKDPAGLIRTLREQVESSVGKNNSIAQVALMNHPKVIEIRDRMSVIKKTRDTTIGRVQAITLESHSNNEALLEEAFRKGDIDTIKFLVQQGVTEVTKVTLGNKNDVYAQDFEKMDTPSQLGKEIRASDIPGIYEKHYKKEGFELVSRISILQNGDIVEFSNLKEDSSGKIAHKLRITQINQITTKDNVIEVVGVGNMVYSLGKKHYSAYGAPMTFKIPKSGLRSGIYVQVSIEGKKFIDAPITRMRVRTNDAHAFKSSLFGLSPARLSH